MNPGTGIRAGLLLVALIFRLVPASAANPAPTATPQPGRALPWILVTPGGPADGGDFGPGTPGTKTAGIQEALDFAKTNRRDVHVAGGAMPGAFQNGAVYNIAETIRIPWMQDFRFDSGEAVLNYTATSGDVVRMDSQMSCHYKFGLIVATQSGGTVLHLKPESKGPDGFSVITTSIFEINALVGGGGVFPGEGVKGRGVGLWLDGSAGTIDSNKFTIAEVIACDDGVKVDHGTSNTIEIIDLHLCNRHMELAPAAAYNRVAVTINSNGIPDAGGLLLRGRNNVVELSVLQAGEGRGLVFGPESRDNLVTTLALAGGFTNKAEVPTSRLVTAYPVGFSVATPPVPGSGVPLVNREPFTVEILILSPGDVSGWTLTDAAGTAQRIESGLTPGQTLRLDPGESITMNYGKSPAWRWKAVR